MTQAFSITHPTSANSSGPSRKVRAEKRVAGLCLVAIDSYGSRGAASIAEGTVASYAAQ